MLSPCWEAEVGDSGARPLGIVALDGNWAVVDEEEVEGRSPSVGAGAMLFVSDMMGWLDKLWVLGTLSL